MRKPADTSRQDGGKVSVGSISFLILISASKFIGPQAYHNRTNTLSIAGFFPSSGFQRLQPELAADFWQTFGVSAMSYRSSSGSSWGSVSWNPVIPSPGSVRAGAHSLTISGAYVFRMLKRISFGAQGLAVPAGQYFCHTRSVSHLCPRGGPLSDRIG